ncbi:MAG: hypothetical protein QOC88_3310 [Mycobacterium sp.]|nr:hypothetical protein [Mycobacterium sp.]MDT5204962.1 hypothetical protein [Mycobacterium sp.]MDT7735503.1 hypothetical protein [Mycobacterium sp.]
MRPAARIFGIPPFANHWRAGFSTPMPALQSFGARSFPDNTFGILAQGRTGAHQSDDSAKSDAADPRDPLIG